MSGVQTVEISWGKECKCGAVDWVFMNPHAITFTTSERLSFAKNYSASKNSHTHVGTCAYAYAASHIFTHMYARVHALQLKLFY